MSPRGRRPAGEDARADIVRAAREEFAAKGYDATSLRAVARAAGVDPALVHHYFDGKPDLFTATLDLPVNPRRRIDEVLQLPHDQLGAAVVRVFLSVWDSPEGRDRMAALLRSVASHDAAARLLREFVVREVVGRLAAHVSPQRVDARAALVGSQLIGLAMLRYVLEVPGVAEASVEDLVRDVGPTVQRYLEL
ncbi:TetR/AcrR family transcriptional regulator [Arsenicicoccus sp. oral taxon 190]|uniref:TetR/AcrR family transcriptional regulator n=1 Tax=Arsenicicoccus sp. oral taxon 190 TaxID=1658671 RepID=UPI00067A3B96|nr:TetR family transcriptional regulator [Arsenicicoccus sp. oral taxon 190]AKT51183.1 hypothetical protein ADJ73_07425 [Arsenicicoccus sp. oral taxon 190]